MMDLRQITPDFAVAAQITPQELPALAAQGFRTLINNRPDDEIEAALDSEAMALAASSAGLAYHHLPFFPGRMTPELVAAFETVMADAAGPVLAYCRSGTRSSYLWAMLQAGRQPVEDILAAASRAGYDHSSLVPLLEAHAEKR